MRMASADHPRRITEWELVRVLACLCVFFGHLLYLNGAREYAGRAVFALSFGREAVICFFMLSGLVNRHAIDARRIDGLAFAHSRAMRLLPLYYTVLLVSFLLEIQLGNSLTLRLVLGHLCFQQTLQGFVVHILKCNSSLWTMSYEVFFYGMMSFSIMAGKNFQRCWCVLAAIGLFGATFTSSTGWLAQFASMLGYSATWLAGYYAKDILKGVSFSRYAAFVLIGLVPIQMNVWKHLGSPAAYFVTGLLILPAILRLRPLEEDQTPQKRFVGSILGIVGFILFQTWLWSDNQPLIRTAILSLIPVLTCAMSWLVERTIGVLSWRYPDQIFLAGRASYCFYLFHFPVIWIADRLSLSLCWKFVFICLSLPGVVYVLEWHLQPLFTRARRVNSSPASE
jgi:peptidoglycan/LPS O-acetylase OafA/YrhL